MAKYMFLQICVFIDIKHLYTCVYNSKLYNFIIDGPLAFKKTLKMILVFKHPLKQSKKANMLQKKCAMTPFSHSHLDGCYFPLILLLHRGNEAVLICCLLVSIFGLFSDVYFTKMIRIELALDHTCYPYIIKPFSYEVMFIF